MRLFLWLLICGFSLGLFLTLIGGYMLLKSTPFDKVTQAEVIVATCNNGKCTVELKFVDFTDKTFIKKAQLNRQVAAGDKITIIYDSTNPNNFYPGRPPVGMVGGIIAFVGLGVLMAMAVWLYLRHRATSSPPPSLSSYMVLPSSSPSPTETITTVSTTTPST